MFDTCASDRWTAYFQLIGSFGVLSRAGPVDLRISDRTREILAYLALNANRDVRRSRLLLMLWPERSEAGARALLNTAVWRIKKAIRDAAPGASVLSRGEVLRLATDATVVVDAVALEEAIRRVNAECSGSGALLPETVRACLARILDTEGIEFLEGSASDWVLVERERLFNLQVRGLSLLMQDRAEAGRFEEALEYGRKILRMDPMRESVQRQVIWLYVLSGQCYAAIRQYRGFSALLEREAGIGPMPETQALHDHIVAAAGGRAMLGKRDGERRSTGGQQEKGVEIESRRLEHLFALLSNQREMIFAVLADSPLA